MSVVARIVRLVVEPIALVITFFANVDRSIYAILGGCLFLAASAYFNWLSVPSAELSSVSAGGDLVVVDGTPLVGVIARTGVGVFAGLVVLALLLGRSTAFRMRRPAWVMGALVLSLPFLINQWDERVQRDLWQLYADLDRISTDLDHRFNQYQVQWRTLQTFEDPEAYTIYLTSSYEDVIDIDIFDPIRLRQIIQEILGFSDAFVNIAGAGWYLAICGFIALIHGMYLLRPEKTRRNTGPDSLFAMATLVAVFGLWLAPRVVAEFLVARVDRALATGQMERVVPALTEAALWKPFIKGTLDYRADLGNAYLAAGCTTCPATYLAETASFMKGRQFLAAATSLEQYLQYVPDDLSMARWLATAYTEQGIKYFNAGQIAKAGELFGKAIALFPTRPVAWYGLTFVDLRHHDFEAAARDWKAISALQSYMGFKRLPIGAETRTAAAWAAYRAGDYEGAHASYSLAHSPDSW